ncbi:phasin family protein [Marinobacterium rhizophilum]|uniref:Phasin family protein n=1 Tax=Marinobacterium rhizophilum TaxID=420402 RepID=A0ABY5HKF7_9GAMM|nr:phasin family protein [Marinobacterium rhizophilum]UTW11705.1 phasin family protein [Marinobacterium rhizophilum]
MFQDFTKQFGTSMEPFKDLVNVQTKMLEELTRQQMECTKSCIEATIQQTREMQKCQNATDLMELQQAYAKELEETLRSVGEQNLKALQDARSAIDKITQSSFESFNPK